MVNPLVCAIQGKLSYQQVLVGLDLHFALHSWKIVCDLIDGLFTDLS